MTDATTTAPVPPRPRLPQIAAGYYGVSKRFGVVRALSDVDLEIRAGTIHALVGENGAGKSTALGVLAGRIAPSSGHVELLGRTLAASQPREARKSGLAAIYQELTIVPALSAEANVFVGRALSRRGLLSTRRMRRRYEELCGELGVPAVPSSTPAGQLSVADQQLLEIMRALAFDAEVLLFDEPTASLGMAERRSLLALMRRLREGGKTIVFVSHNIDEVLEVSDDVTVFRAGRLVSTRHRDGLTKHDVVQHMLGQDADLRLLRSLQDEAAAPPARARTGARDAAAPVVRVEGLSVPGAIDDVALEVRPGEILGLGGLVGSGRTTVLRALAGLEPRAKGRLWLDGAPVPWPTTVRRARRYGIALAPEDRKTQGLVLEMPAGVNVTMSDLSRVARGGWVSESRLRRAAQDAATPFGFDPERIGEDAGHLSGGNQQKLLLARWRHSPPRLLLVDEPTRGIDIGAKEEVLSAFESLAAEGLAIVVVSSELEELTVVSDRVAVLAEGRLVGHLRRDEEGLSVAAILEQAFAAGGTNS